jgi:hypothetical protein
VEVLKRGECSEGAGGGWRGGAEVYGPHASCSVSRSAQNLNAVVGDRYVGGSEVGSVPMIAENWDGEKGRREGREDVAA